MSWSGKKFCSRRLHGAIAQSAAIAVNSVY